MNSARIIAILSLMFGIIAYGHIFFSQNFALFSLPAIILGHIALFLNKQDKNLHTKWISIIGAFLGYFMVIPTVLFIILGLFGVVLCN